MSTRVSQGEHNNNNNRKPHVDRREKKTLLTSTHPTTRCFTRGLCATLSPGIFWSPRRTPEARCPGKGANAAIPGAVSMVFFATDFSARKSHVRQKEKSLFDSYVQISGGFSVKACLTRF